MNNFSQQQNSYSILNDYDSSNNITITVDPRGTLPVIYGNGMNYSYGSTAINENGVNISPHMTTPLLKVDGDIVLNGESLDDRLSRIEKVLQLPTRDVTIEEQYPKLKKIYQEYMKELEKYKTWNSLRKGANND